MELKKKSKQELIKRIEELEEQLKSTKSIGKSGSVSDISAEKDQVLQMITDNASGLIAILDLKGRRLYNSKSYTRILGDPEKLKGTDSFREIHPDDLDKIKKVFEDTVKSGNGQRAEYRMISEDGDIRYIESQGNVILGPKGNIENVIVISRDITDRENIERALQDSEERLSAIFKAIPDVIYRLDPTGKITFISDAISRYGYRHKQLKPLSRR